MVNVVCDCLCRWWSRVATFGAFVASSPRHLAAFSFIDSPQLTILFGLHYSLDARSVGRLVGGMCESGLRLMRLILPFGVQWDDCVCIYIGPRCSSIKHVLQWTIDKRRYLPRKQKPHGIDHCHSHNSQLTKSHLIIYCWDQPVCRVPNSLCVDFVVIVWFCFCHAIREPHRQTDETIYALLEGCGNANETD